MKDKEVLKTGKELVTLTNGEVKTEEAATSKATTEAATGEYSTCLFLCWRIMVSSVCSRLSLTISF